MSTYGIGRDLSRPQWAAVGRELMRLGFVGISEGEFATLELTSEGIDVLKTRTPVTLTKPMLVAKAKRASVRREGEIACDEILFERLRALRRELADERQVPAYIIFGDNTLRAMARYYPTSIEAMDGIPGVGEKKRAEFGELFAAEISAYLATNARVAFA